MFYVEASEQFCPRTQITGAESICSYVIESYKAKLDFKSFHSSLRCSYLSWTRTTTEQALCTCAFAISMVQMAIR